MKKTLLATLILLSGCNETDSKTPIASSMIVLECSGENIGLKDKKRTEAQYLIKIDPNNRYQMSLHYFSGDEERFIPSCELKYSECTVTVDSNLIQEVGVLRRTDNSIILLETAKINRRTGRMETSLTESTYGERTTFIGECIKGVYPSQAQQKF